MASLDLDSVFALIEKESSNLNNIKSFTELVNGFRFLRNYCITPENQNAIIQNDSILRNTTKILSTILTRYKNEAVCLQVGLQFLGNLVVNNKTTQEKVWNDCRVFLGSCLKNHDDKVQNCTAMILYNIFLGYPEFLNDAKEIVEDLITMSLSEFTSEFSMFILELLVLKSDFIMNCYDQLKQEHKLIILEIIRNLVVDQNNKELSPKVISFLSDKFVIYSDSIIKVCECETKPIDPLETVKILDLLIIFSSDDKEWYFDVISKDDSLLCNSLMLLRSMHLISKQRGNDYSMVSKISEMEEFEKDPKNKEHHGYGFKANLIRLLGNLCWRNTKNQNKVRDLDGISVMLDCCNIDARNPFITQWSIFAIRNCCENNVQNQKEIASLSKEGIIDRARLRELGFKLNTNAEGETLCIAPLK